MLNLVILIILSMQLFQPSGTIMQTPYRGNVKSIGSNEKNSREWNVAIYRGLTMGGSTEGDMIRLLGQPELWELFDEDEPQPESWFHYESGGDFPGELVINIDRRKKVILRMILHPKDLSVKEAVKRFGGDYVITRYEFCEGFEERDSAPLYEHPTGQFRYIEYRKRGMALAYDNNDKVNFIVYVSEPIGSRSSECKK